ncbi:PilZ domain-containing protein [[Archangium] primigenium]|uniref:PilZ domain-containing protein n=1 Tax=Melittangium TaxID=44 RepID=UPI00195C379C|nr:PilZ domain-containing protein [Archangium primigenium]MBM7115340.1 PilZ domain-containing protein [Archangium primigenium]
MSGSSGPERRRHPRHRVRLRIQFLRNDSEVAGEIFNISRSGCLLVTPVKMNEGERFSVYLPTLGHSQVIQVVRIRPTGMWFVVAVNFEPQLLDESVLLKLASQDTGPQEEPEQLF